MHFFKGSRREEGFQSVFLLHLEDWDPEGEFKRPKLQLISACHPAKQPIASFLKFVYPNVFHHRLTRLVVSQSAIEMDSSAIYINASSEVVAEGPERYNLAIHERRAFDTGLVPNMMEWKWCDLATGETLAYAFDDEPPELPELKKWVPTDLEVTWDDLPDDETEVLPQSLYVRERPADCVMVYQYCHED
jgi:hypothetical protein